MNGITLLMNSNELRFLFNVNRPKFDKANVTSRLQLFTK